MNTPLLIDLYLLWAGTMIGQFLLWACAWRKQKVKAARLLHERTHLQGVLRDQRDLSEDMAQDYNEMLKTSDVFASVLHKCDKCRSAVTAKFKQKEEKDKLSKLGVDAYNKIKVNKI